jgi:predicted acyl esterase
MWLDRLEHTPPFVEAWVTHQRRDAFWQHGSVCEDFAAITCPVYAVGGWADSYTNAIPRLLEGLPGPRKGLIGPWAHLYPHQGVPGPAIGFLQECLRWWDYWLKGLETGIMDEPMLRTWMQDAVEPHPFYAERPGRWVADPSWPSPHITQYRYAVNETTLDAEAAAEVRRDWLGEQQTGIDAGAWGSFGLPTDLPPDQREEDGRSVTFTAAPLAAPMEILGFPEVTLTVAVDRPIALLAVRLCDVAPAGSSTLVTRGLLNLTHRDSHVQPTPLQPGARYTVTVRLDAVAYVLPAGHSWRLAVSPTYWPWVWPSPEPVTLSIFSGGASQLTLPVRAPRPEDASLAPFEPAEGAAPPALEILRPATNTATVSRDVASGRVELAVETAEGFRLLDRGGLAYDAVERDTYVIVEGNPLSATTQCARDITVGRGAWQTRVKTHSTMSADAVQFHVTNVLDAYEGDVRVFAKTWTFSVPRDLC